MAFIIYMFKDPRGASVLFRDNEVWDPVHRGYLVLNIQTMMLKYILFFDIWGIYSDWTSCYLVISSVSTRTRKFSHKQGNSVARDLPPTFSYPL